MTERSLPDCPRLDEYCPDFHVRSAHQITVHASREQTFTALSEVDFSDSWIVKMLMTIRSLGRKSSSTTDSGSSQDRLKRSGFLELAIEPEREVVYGIVGRFWRPTGNICHDISAQEFKGFNQPGFAKAVWNFSLTEISPQETLLRTQTRVNCLGQAAAWKFRAYWFVVGPFSGLIRMAMLRQVKARAEAVRSNSPVS